MQTKVHDYYKSTIDNLLQKTILPYVLRDKNNQLKAETFYTYETYLINY